MCRAENLLEDSKVCDGLQVVRHLKQAKVDSNARSVFLHPTALFNLRVKVETGWCGKPIVPTIFGYLKCTDLMWNLFEARVEKESTIIVVLLSKYHVDYHCCYMSWASIVLWIWMVYEGKTYCVQYQSTISMENTCSMIFCFTRNIVKPFTWSNKISIIHFRRRVVNLHINEAYRNLIPAASFHWCASQLTILKLQYERKRIFSEINKRIHQLYCRKMEAQYYVLVLILQQICCGRGS